VALPPWSRSLRAQHGDAGHCAALVAIDRNKLVAIQR